MLNDAYFIAKVGTDIAETEPAFSKKLINTRQTSGNFGDISAASVPERAGRERAAPHRRDHPLPGHDRGTLKKLGYYSLVLTLTSTTHSYFDYFD